MLSLSRCLGALKVQGVDIAPEEFCDAVWLAARGFISGEARVLAPARETQTTTSGLSAPVSSAGRASAAAEEKNTDPHKQAKPGQSVHALGDSGRRMGGTLVALPSAPAITRGIEFDRALRPLRQRRQLRRAVELDEEATVAAIAETGVWQTVMRPTRGRWLDLTLVVEQSPTMRLWQETALEFRRLLGRACAPRSLRTFQLEWSPQRMLMRTSGGRAVSLQAPCQNDGSNPILVLSDAMSFGWLTSDIPELLAHWAARQTTSVVQMLPPSMWKRSALRQVKLGAVAGPRGNGDEWPAVTITTLDPGYLQRYSRMLSGGGAEGVAAYRGSRREFGVVSSQSLQARPAFDPRTLTEEDAERIYQRFEQFSSPEARKLARYLASAPLTLPVMRLVQRVLVADAAPAQLAEIFLSGILYRRPSEATKMVSANQIEYEFIRGVRERLLDLGGLELSFETIRLLSNYFEKRLGKGGAFTALLADPSAAAKTFSVAGGGPGDQPFARVAGMLLERMGFDDGAAEPSRADSDEQPAPAPNVATVSKVHEKHEPPSKLPESTSIKADISRIFKYAPAEFIGREAEFQLLNQAWQQVRQAESRRPHVITFVAFGGEGKTSLVSKWAADLAAQNWPGCDAVFAWSFYSQGTQERVAASSDTFLAEALNFFGDPQMATSAASAFDKGRRLAQLVGGQRVLLILDGLEPLQYAPTSPMPGELKDQGIAGLLKTLAVTNRGLCIVTTRYPIPELLAFSQTTAPEVALARLSREAGVHLLRMLGVKGTEAEFQKLVEDVKGHPLTLNLIGSYLRDAHRGDIRKRDLVRFEDADFEEAGGSSFHMYAAYTRWLESEGAKGKQAVAMLRLMAFFDRPATVDCLTALLKAPAISGLTEPLIGLSDAQRNMVLSRLEATKLLTILRDSYGTLLALDARQLLREYFERELREQNPDAWRAGHRRLYAHLTTTTADLSEPNIEDLQPLAQAIASGCQAGLYQQVFDEVYLTRLQRNEEAYVWRRLAAFGTDLGAIVCFFEQPWVRVSPSLSDRAQAFVLHNAAFDLRALGRVTEAAEPMRAAVRMRIMQEDWKNAATSADNLSELELTLGHLAGAVLDAEQGVAYADRSGDGFRRMANRTTHADALHQAGRRPEAEMRYREAEQMQAEHQPDYPLFFSLPGFRYCDFLIAAPERAAWQAIFSRAEPRHRRPVMAALRLRTMRREIETCRVVSRRALHTLQIAERNAWLLDIALDHLTLGRAAVDEAVLEHEVTFKPLQVPNEPATLKDDDRRSDLSTLQTARYELAAAVDGLRRAGQQQYLPLGLLTRAWLRFLNGARTGPESAQEDLDEAWEIAERGPMRLHMADIHLYRARLFGGMKDKGGGMKYPWDTNPDGTPRGPKDDLAAARKLIEQCGYWRRKEELEDAEEAAKNW